MNKKHRKQYHGKAGSKSVKLIRQYFPKVTELRDATSKAIIEVTADDSSGGTVKDPALCAFARACYHHFKADGVIIGLKVTYVISGTIATRYQNPESLSREIVSFDRKGGFDPGRYHLRPHCPAARLGIYRARPTHPKRNGADRRAFKHFTRGVRVLHPSEEVRV